MKANHILMSRKWIFYSLFLLSPGILAAENLNFNYTQAGELSLDPRLGLQAKACHSKSDPMDIRVHFDNINVGSNFNVTLAIQGAEYPKSYGVFTKAVQSKQSVPDPDFMVPWRVNVKGGASGNYNFNAYHSATTPEWGDSFCFILSKPEYDKYPFTDGFRPYFYGEPEYNQYCGNKPLLYDQYYVWGGNPKTTNMPSWYDKDFPTGRPPADQAWYTAKQRFLAGNIKFFTTYKPGKPAFNRIESAGFNNSTDKEFADSKFTYRFPLGADNNLGVQVDNGDFVLRLNNRNISALTLTVTNANASEVWSWKAANDDAYKNRLYLNHQPTLGMQPSVSDASDPYLTNKFYKENRYYKGTLTPGVYLMPAYTDYIRNIMPLSLPATSDGEINLVNTDSLTFTIGKVANAGGYGSLSFRAYGQPMKFAPLVANGKEVASAMQIRNACY
ncbi:hypothetical protein D6T17_28115 [Salmonella enterica subsp. enterica serovar Oranienburg]|uniref:Uncharacterized protein n=1 Tax=Salmonella enterica TaxID=28901 RepID=A0A743TWT5_SALER|nr:hypothetical protein [Salmonella enterica subsp. enterica serovar Oranienburg]EDM1360389.1 hypothetical protein [Salmonella enterica subsp. enterica serovar Newport]EGO9992548.1 hypothetical protein [Salmonella enterica]EBY8948075.1 hypothetical protein [Salmonella enterica subsp. enterica serovar Oranienburg]HAF1420913.1 hypothetical protein [Salmonella enterica]